MGFIDNIKNAVGKVVTYFTEPTVTDAQHGQADHNGYRRTTTASRRAEAQANTRYLHESSTLQEVPKNLQPLLGTPFIRVGKGRTYYSQSRAVKQEADRLAERLELPNKARRRLRSAMVRRLGELQAAA